MQDQLSKGANTLSEAAKNALFASIAARKKSCRREAEDAQADLEADEQKILQQLGEKILAVVQRYAHENGYAMVLDVGANNSPVLDITKEIVTLRQEQRGRAKKHAKLFVDLASRVTVCPTQ